MSDIRFTIDPVNEKPKKSTNKGRSGSKYLPILTGFLESGHELVRVDGTGKEANYLKAQLNRIIKKKGLDSVTVSVRKKQVYLEKTDI